MKRVLILAFVTILALTMASCDWDPTGIGTDRGNDRDDKKERDDKDDDRKERDVVMVRGVEGDVITTPCDFTFTVESIVVTENESDVVTNTRSERTVVVIIVVTKRDGTTETYTLTPDAPSVTIGDCTIYLKGVSPIRTRDTDRVQQVASFAITTGR